MTGYEIVGASVDFILKSALIGLILVGIGFLTTPILYFWQRLRRIHLRNQVVTTPPVDELPHVVIQLPVWNEPHVVSDLLESVMKLAWPKDKLHIQLLDDSTDLTSEIAAEKIVRAKETGFLVDHVRRESRDGFKAGALAAGLALSDAPFVGIFDADFRPPSNWLCVVLPKLMADSTAAFIQSRCEFVNANQNWLTRAQGLLFDAHFVMEQEVRAHSGLFFQFNGTAGVWRRAAIEDAGGWKNGSLSEDLDLTLRAELAGWHGLFCNEPAVAGLVPDRLRHWGSQQRRWAMGFAQTARELTIAIGTARWPVKKRVFAGFLVLYQAFLPLTAFTFLMFIADAFLQKWSLASAAPYFYVVFGLTLLVSLGMTLPPYLALRRGPIGRYLFTVAALPLLIFYLSLTNGFAIIRAFFSDSDRFDRTPKRGNLSPSPTLLG